MHLVWLVIMLCFVTLLVACCAMHPEFDNHKLANAEIEEC